MRRDEPIIQSLTDVDIYKINMMQLYHKLHRDIPAKFAFTNRTRGVDLGRVVDMGQLREEMAHIATLRHAASEIQNYRDSGRYSEEFLKFLAGLQLPACDIWSDAADNGRLHIETPVAPIPEITLWETLTLSVVNELYYRQVMKDRGLNTTAGFGEIARIGERRLRDKISVLQERGPVQFIEFGTRRRFSRAWQRSVLEILKEEVPSMLMGTSNVALASEFGLKPIGTMAHELFMAYACIFGGTDEGLLGSQSRVIDDWERMYGPKLLIALSDTFGTEFFFRNFGPMMTGRWSGVRQDSGDPLAFAEKTIAHYQRCGIDPTEKTIVFSDGLNVNEIFRIDDAVDGRIGTVYGWGTDLTNDVGFKSLSLVMKLVMASWRYAVKLSDNPAKHMGPAAEVWRAKRVFQYSGGLYVPLHS